MTAADNIVSQFQGDALAIADELVTARARLEEERRVMTCRAARVAEDVGKVEARRHQELMRAQDEAKQLRHQLDQREPGIERLQAKYGPLGEGLVPLAEVYELLGLEVGGE